MTPDVLSAHTVGRIDETHHEPARDACPSHSGTSASDAAIAATVSSGGAVSMPAMFTRYRGPAMALATRICGPALAEDVVQDAFFSIWRSSATYRPDRGGVSAWVLSVVRNRSIDALRRDSRHSRRRESADMLDSLAGPGETDAIVVDREEAFTLRSMLATLPADQARVIDLAYFGELTHAEIAGLMGLPLGTVKGRIRLGLATLRTRDSGLAARAWPKPASSR